MTEKEKLTHLFSQYQKLDTETEDYIDTLTAALADIQRGSRRAFTDTPGGQLKADKTRTESHE
jgi:hypothetical protein